MEKINLKAERARQMRYKQGAVRSIAWETMTSDLYEIISVCDDTRYYIGDGEELVDALDGDIDEANEFRMAFAELSAEASQIDSMIEEMGEGGEEYYNDCTVSLLGRHDAELMGFDAYEEDYFSLNAVDSQLAVTESGKRMMRLTKENMLITIGTCMTVAMAYLDLRYKFDYLTAAIDVLKNRNASVLDTVRDIEALYAKACDYWSSETVDKFNRLCAALPERIWVE